jgi:SAM-dependent methyltransferase
MKKCIICGGDRLEKIFNPDSNQPLSRYALSDNKKQAINSDKFPITVFGCKNCMHFFNFAFDSNAISYKDDNVQEGRPFSLAYTNYQKKKASMILERYVFEDQTILEIGCGNGEFISQFSKKNKLIGYEPSPESLEVRNNIEVINEYFIPDVKLHKNLKPSLIIMRHVLEHVSNPLEYLKTFFLMLSNNNSDNKLLYLEVPSNNKTIEKDRFSDYYYDHASYFSLSSLSYALNEAGFFVEDLSLDFNREIISCIASVNSFNKIEGNLNANFDNWKNIINHYYENNKKIIFWGTAGTGTMFLNMLNVNSIKSPYVIDSDERKQKKYVPGTGQLVVEPKFIQSYKPDVVIILSQLHSKEINDTISGLIDYDVITHTID